MNIATAITTAPREEYWLTQCVHGLRNAGLPEPFFVFAEPESVVAESIQPHILLRKRPERLGAWCNWLEAMDETLQLSPSADAVLLVQDDAVLCRDAGRWLAANLWPSEDCGCVAVYTSRGYRGYTERGLRKLPERFYDDFWGACALCFPSRVARLIVGYARQHGWRGHCRSTLHDSQDKRAIDVFVGTAMRFLNCDIWICNPSLARHDAATSTLGHGQACGNRRRALDYHGDSVSAFTVMGGT